MNDTLCIFDSHSHYTDAAFDPDRDALLRSFPEKGVRRCMVCGTTLTDSAAGIALAEQYPALAKAGRPAEVSQADTSIRDYSIGEYKTYSENTLGQLLQDLKRMENPVLEIQKNLVSFYGFDSLEAAEAAQRR